MDHALRVRQQFVMATGRITFGTSCKMDTLNFELLEMYSLSLQVTTITCPYTNINNYMFSHTDNTADRIGW